MTSSNAVYDGIILPKCFDDVRMPLKKTLKMNITTIYITSSGFLLVESYESTIMNKIFKTILRRSLCKVKYVVLLTLKVCLIDKLK